MKNDSFKHSSMSLLSLSRMAAFKLSLKAEILSSREGMYVNFHSENGSVYGASNSETSFCLFAWIKRVNFWSREPRRN